MDFKGRRVEAHNSCPQITEFRAEANFRDHLVIHGGETPFTPIQLSANNDAEYQRCVGHLIDGLDALPHRPDYFFDHCLRVLDLAQGKVAPKKGIRGVMERLPAALLKLDTPSWEQTVNALAKGIPQVTVDFLAKRLLDSYAAGTDQHKKQLRDRAETCMGKAFYSAFCQKFLNDQNGQPLANFHSNLPKAGSLLRLYLSGVPGTRTKPVTHPDLDIHANPIGPQRRMQVMLSLLLFTVRNDRAHGAVISPFRTRKRSSIGMRATTFSC